MLQAIRSQAGSFIIKVLFGVLIVSFGVWGIGDIFRGRSTETVVATVGSEEITAQELQEALQPAVARLEEALGRKFDLQQIEKTGLLDSLVKGLVEKSLVSQEVSRLGLVVPDEMVRDAILGDPEFQSSRGGFDRFRFDQLLASNHLTEGQYVARLRRDIPARQLLHAVSAAATPPPLLVDTLYRYENEKRVAAIAFLPLASAPKSGPPDAAALRRFYEAHKDLFRAPEYRGFVLASLTPADLAHSIKIPEAKLKEAYREAEASLRVPERRQVEQMLLPSEEKAEAAEKALAAGEPFKQVATKIAAAPPDTTDLGLVTKKGLPAPLADAAFALKLNTPSKPIHSAFGWHILEVVKIVPPTAETFAEARPKLLAQLQRSKAAESIYKIGENVDDAIAGGLGLSDAAKKFGLKLSTIKAADLRGDDPAGKAIALPVPSERVMKLAYSTDKGQTTRVMHLDDGAIFALHVDRITPARIKSLEEVKGQAIAALEARERRQAVAKEAAALAAAVSPKQPLNAVAAAKGVTVTTSGPLGREGDSKLPPDLVDRLFAVKPGAAVTASGADGSYVAELLTIKPAKAAAKGVTVPLAEGLTSAMRADLGTQFTQALRARFPVTIHQSVIDKMF